MLKKFGAAKKSLCTKTALGLGVLGCGLVVFYAPDSNLRIMALGGGVSLCATAYKNLKRPSPAAQSTARLQNG